MHAPSLPALTISLSILLTLPALAQDAPEKSPTPTKKLLIRHVALKAGEAHLVRIYVEHTNKKTVETSTTSALASVTSLSPAGQVLSFELEAIKDTSTSLDVGIGSETEDAHDVVGRSFALTRGPRDQLVVRRGDGTAIQSESRRGWAVHVGRAYADAVAVIPRVKGPLALGAKLELSDQAVVRLLWQYRERRTRVVSKSLEFRGTRRLDKRLLAVFALKAELKHEIDYRRREIVTGELLVDPDTGRVVVFEFEAKVGSHYRKGDPLEWGKRRERRVFEPRK